MQIINTGDTFAIIKKAVLKTANQKIKKIYYGTRIHRFEL